MPPNRLRGWERIERRCCTLAWVWVGASLLVACEGLLGLDGNRYERDSDPTTSNGGQGGNTSTGGKAGAGGGSGGSGNSGNNGGTNGSGGSGVVTCTSQYGDAPGFQVCQENETACHFETTTMLQCGQLCEARGGRCYQPFGSGPPCENISYGGDCYQTPPTPGGCVCSVGCGDGPPCVPPQICTQADVCQ